ncbi:nucleotidyltransferase family protein [bacterium]|nr:nucleotidyltransferase family protein [bacterium]
MKISDCSIAKVASALATSGIGIQFGSYEFQVQSPIDAIAVSIHTLYGDREFRGPSQCPDFRVRVDPGVHKFRRCVYASVNGQIWKRWPKRLTVGALEWVCNWCFFRGVAGKFALHAATAEVPSGEGAIVFPGLSGAGKSTLAATLMLSDWRLLSDEVALFDLKDTQLTGLGRSTVLKGDSLQLIREGFPGRAVFGPAGRMLEPPGPVAHLRPSPASTEICGQTFRPLAFCFPERRPNAAATIETFDTAACFSHLSQLGLNYRFLGPSSFNTLLALVEKCPAYRLIYTNATDAEKLLRELGSDGNLVGSISTHLSISTSTQPEKTHKESRGKKKQSRSLPATSQQTNVSTTLTENPLSDLSENNAMPTSLTCPPNRTQDSNDATRQQLIAALRGNVDLTTLTLRDWDTLLLLASHLELGSQLATSILRTANLQSLPPEVSRTLDHALQAVTFNHKLHTFELKFLKRIAKASNTQPILLKGAAYLACKHAWAAGRKTNDVDLLLASKSLDGFEVALKSEGYEADDELSPSDRRYYRKWLHELPPYKHSYRKLEVDVHFRLLPVSDPRSFPVEDWIERSRSLNDPSPFRVLDPVDQVLHAIINLGHTGEFRRATRDTWDISCLTNPLSQEFNEQTSNERVVDFDWQELHQRTNQLRLQKTVSHILLLGEELVGLSMPENFIEDITGKSKSRLRQSLLYRTMKMASLPDGPTLRSRRRYHALWAMEHYPLPKLSTWLDPLTWTKRFHFMTDE